MKSPNHHMSFRRPCNLHTLPRKRTAGITARGFVPATALGLLLILLTPALAVEPLLTLKDAGGPLGISADGSRLFTIDRSHLYSWSRANGELLNTLELPVEIPGRHWQDAAVSHDGRLLALSIKPVIEEGVITVLDTQSGETLSVIPHEGWVNAQSLGFSPDDSLLCAVGSNDEISSARVWNARSGEVLAEIVRDHWPHEDSWWGIEYAGFSPNGDRLLLGGARSCRPHCEGGFIALWDFSTRPDALTVLETPEPIHTVALSGDGQLVAAAGTFEESSWWVGLVRLWNADTGVNTQTLEIGRLPMVGWELPVSGMIRFSSDGQYLLEGKSGIWDVRTGRRVGVLPFGSWAKHAHDSRFVLSGLPWQFVGSGEVQLWAVNDLLSNLLLRGTWPAQPSDTTFYPQHIAAKGDFAYLAASDQGLIVIDASDPQNPRQVGQCQTTGGARWVVVSERFAYVMSRNNDHIGTLDVIDVRDPTSPVLMGAYSPGDENWGWGLEVSGTRAYVSTRWWGEGGKDLWGFEAIDLSDPTNPQHLGYFESRGARLKVHGDLAYAVSNGLPSGWAGLEILDLGDLTNPSLVGAYTIEGAANDVAIAGNYAYIAGGKGECCGLGSGADALVILDVSDPANPRKVGSYDRPTPAQNVLVSGNLAYLHCSSEGAWEVLDVANPTQPRLVARVLQSDFGYYTLRVAATERMAHLVLTAVEPGHGLSSGYLQLMEHPMLTLRFGQTKLRSEGHLELPLFGPSGQRLRVQRSTNLRDWEDLQTVTLDGTGVELIDDSSGAAQRFYRVVDEGSEP